MEPSLKCLLDTPLLTIQHDITNGWLYNQWKGAHDPNTVFACIHHILACLEATACRKILSDHTEFIGNWLHVAPRVGSEAFEQIAARGVVAVAWVYGKNYHDQMAMYLAQRTAARPLITIFGDVASAYGWLQQWPKERSLLNAASGK